MPQEDIRRDAESCPQQGFFSANESLYRASMIGLNLSCILERCSTLFFVSGGGSRLFFSAKNCSLSDEVRVHFHVPAIAGYLGVSFCNSRQCSQWSVIEIFLILIA